MSRLDTEVAERAIALVANTLITAAMHGGYVKRKDFHIIVGTHTGDVLAEHSMGDPEKWKHGYHEIAKSKFDITVRTKMSSREVQTCFPELAGEDGDTIYWGSHIDGGIVVACSGVEPYWDEAFSKAITAIIRAMVTEKQENDVALGQPFLTSVGLLVLQKGKHFIVLPFLGV